MHSKVRCSISSYAPSPILLDHVPFGSVRAFDRGPESHIRDEKIAEWKRSMLPNLMGSEIGKWMLENNLTEYYSEQMNKELREAAAAASQSNTSTATVGDR